MRWNRPSPSSRVAWRAAVLLVLAVGASAAWSQEPAQASDCSLDGIRSVLAGGYLARVRGCSYDTVAPLLNRYDLSPRRENVASSEPAGTIVGQDPDPQGLTSRGTISTVRLFVSDGSISPPPAETARVDVGLSLQPPTDSSGLAEGDVKLWLVVANRGPASAEATRVKATLQNVKVKRVYGACEVVPCTVTSLWPTSSASIFMIVTPLNTGDGVGPVITFVATPGERESAPDDNTVSRSFAAKAASGLTTVVETLVPDVIDKPLEEAVALVERAGLRAQVDAGPRPGPKTVRGQRPAAAQRVQAGSAVALRAMTRVQVPEVRQRTCDEARELARAAGLDTGPCSVEGRFGIKLGTPIVWTQSLEVGRTVDEGETMALGARTPAAPVAALGAGLGALLVAGTVAFVKRPSKADPPPPPPPPQLDVRIDVDPAPKVAIRAPLDQASNQSSAPARSGDHEFGRALRLRINAAEPRVWIRAWDPSDREAPYGRDTHQGERPT